MKKHIKSMKLQFLFVILLVISLNQVVLANGTEARPTQDSLKEASFHWPGSGSANSYATITNAGKKCEPTDLCFSENAMYVKLLRYDYKTKNVETVATILFYNGGTLSDATVVDKPAEEAERVDSWLLNFIGSVLDLAKAELMDGHTTGKATVDKPYKVSHSFYAFEEITIYDKQHIKVCSTSKDCTSGKVKVIYDPNLPKLRNGTLANYVKEILQGKYFASTAAIKETFGVNNYDLRNLEEYYFAFEPVARVGIERKEDILNEKYEQKISTLTPDKVDPWFYLYCPLSRENRWVRATSIDDAINSITVPCGSTTTTYSCSLNSNTYSSSSNCKSGCKKTTYKGYGCAGNSPDTAITYDSEKKCNDECDTTCTSSTTSGTCTENTTSNTGSWEYSYKAEMIGGEIRYSILFTREYKGVSKLVPARETGKLSLIRSLVSDYYGGPVKHCILDSNNECTNKFEYYIGPTLNTALVSGGGDSKYQLWDYDLGAAAITSGTASTYSVGVSYWWLPDVIQCTDPDVCGGKQGDELLKCAENFCDNAIAYDSRANTNKLKEACILNDCDYKYTRFNCLNNNPYLSAATPDTSLSINATNVCSTVETGRLPNGPSEKNIRTITTCESDTSTVFDQMNFLIVACKESSSFKYKDLSTRKIVAGEGLDYFAKLKGEKECSVFIDVDSWKLVYASIHSKDEVIITKGGVKTVKNSRQLMEELLDYFNSGLKNGVNVSIGIDFAGNDVAISWDQLNYSINKVSVKTKVTEIINNKKEHSNEYTLVRGNTIEDGTPTTTSTATNYTVGYGRYVGKTMSINSYINRSVVDVNYVFDKHCVTSDGRASIYGADAQGKCNDGNPGRNVYYTSLNATPDRDFIDAFKPIGEGHSINKTVAEIKKNVIGNDIYLKDDEFCPYHIDGGDDVNGDFGCTVVLTPKPGTEMHGNKIFVGGVIATLEIQDNLKNDITIASYGICPYAHHEENGLITIDIDKQDNYAGEETVDITGVVTTSNGGIRTCRTQVVLISDDTGCPAKCSVEKTAVDNLYEIVDIYNNAQNVYTATSRDITFIRVSKNMDRDSRFNGKYIVRADKTEYSYYLYGKVTNVIGSQPCSNVCWNKLPGPELTNCKALYKGGEVAKIKKYCDSSWDKDINAYESSSDCVTQCSSGICELSDDLPKVSNECNIDFANWGFVNVSSCINYCYKSPGGSDYLYRPILNKDPFPNSHISEVKGKRIIGANWIGKEHYITDDDDDFTSATGAHANTNVEFVIDLTPSDIRRIREDIKKYNDSAKGNDSYLDYVYRKGVDEKGKYQSKFIHETFNDLFKVTNGER